MNHYSQHLGLGADLVYSRDGNSGERLQDSRLDVTPSQVLRDFRSDSHEKLAGLPLWRNTREQIFEKKSN